MNRDLSLIGERALPARLALAGAAGVAASTPHAAPRLDLPTLLRIARERKWLIAAAVAVGLVGAVLVTALTTPLFRAWVTLEVNPPSVEVLDEQSRERQSQIGNGWDYVATQVGLLGSRSVAERAAQDLNLASETALVGEGDAAARLQSATGLVAGGLKIEAPDEGQIVRFSYTSDSPEVAARVANGVAEAFINTSLQRRFEASAFARRFLERQIAKTRGDLERSERQLVQYAQQQGIITFSGGSSASGPQAGETLQGESLAALNQALAQATARRVAAEGAYRSAASSGPTAEVNSSTQLLRQTRATLEAEYQDKRALMKPEHPEMISLRNRIEELDRQVARETAQVAGGRTNTLAQEYRAALSAERALQGRVSALKGSVLDLRGRSVRYTILQREVDTNRGLYDALLQRYKEIGVAGGVGTSPVSIVDRAEVPGGPFTPNLPFNLLAGLGIGLIGGLGGAVALEFLNDTVRTREDVRNKLGLACLGQVPKRVGKGSFVEDLQDAGSAVSEAYSAMAAALRFTTPSGAPKSLLVTSTQPSEGKSSTALALAQNFARRGHRVLLVDGDLRKPTFRAATDEVGITRLLTNEESIAEHIAPTQFDRLWLLPCGPLPPNPADLLSTPRFGAIIDEAIEQFDLVIVDAPPVLGLADAPLLAAACHDVLFVVEAGRTRTRAAIDAVNRIEAAGAHVLGGALTKARESDGGYGYYQYRYGALEDRAEERILMIPHHAEV